MRTENATRPWHREPWVWMLLAIPGTAVLMGVVLIVLATLSYDGLVADDYYREGLEIGRAFERDRVALEHEIRLDVVFEASAATVTLNADAALAPPPRLRMSAFHATRQGFDRSAELVAIGAGRYHGPWPALPPGRWHLQIEGERWRVVGRLVTPVAGQAVRLAAHPAS